MTIWDFDENKNYVNVRVHNENYKVLNLKDKSKFALLLSKLTRKIKNQFDFLKRQKRMGKKLPPEIELLIKTPFKLQEMQIPEDQGTIEFDGLNKPKGVKRIKNAISIGKDGKLRASRRLIFLKLRKNYTGSQESSRFINSLLIHELAHTACNHVRYRDDDHGPDFERCERFIKKIFKGKLL